MGLCLGLLLVACGGREGSTEEPGPDTVGTESTDQLVRVGGKLFSVPSPVLMAMLVRDAGLAYQREATLVLDKEVDLTGRAQQALALGMYGADLAYVTTHKDGQRTLATLQTIEKLGAKLELSNAFDKALLDRFRNNLSNEDSLLRFSGAAFRAADEYLRSNERDDISALILAGGWIEALHLTLSDPKASSVKTIVDRVGEQRNTLEGLVEMLSAYTDEPRTAALVGSLKELRAEFDDVHAAYAFEPPVTDREARTTYINSTTSVSISAEKLGAIAGKVASIRSSLLA